MIFLVYFQLGLLVVLTAFTWFFTGNLASTLSTAGGAATTLFNLWVLVAAWPLILAKKQVAFSVGAIVFKFAILGLILYFVVNSKSVHLGWFALGLSTVLPSVLVTAYKMPTLFPDKADEA